MPPIGCIGWPLSAGNESLSLEERHPSMGKMPCPRGFPLSDRFATAAQCAFEALELLVRQRVEE